ncbi:hydrolase [Curtobacterium sp. 'Ferrero']|uniref:endonuclease/exonuclease/phosphatase family protein n=1 Tax=Curtobacterium sp. 'Ferrero' TaxID=2033654 RepID=UPI000BDA296D|nr:endonuclease/exonuclease/phosphatase family protein [Curtobacterium sp. 'Ferrero']PCN47264.1 hydrolase [Curtobacterium sp. 'Ferrero']
MSGADAPAGAPDLHCVTLNVRRPVPHLRRGHPDAWDTRRPALEAFLDAVRPTVLAVQEAVPAQLTVVRRVLGDRWLPVVSARSRARSAEHVGLLVDGERLRVVDRRTVALSTRPDRIGSRSWGSLFPRIAVAAVLDDLATGTRFSAIATHLDPFSPPALRNGARAVGALAASAGTPVVAMADWNASERSSSARVLSDAGLVDTWDVAESRGPASGTLTRYRSPRSGAPRLDRVLVRPGGGWTARVRSASITPTAASDHAAVHAVLRWERTA